MKWQSIRQSYPDSWVVIEALKAYDNNNKHIVEDISSINQYDAVIEAMGLLSIIT
jgi:hypothetical protein